MMYYCCIFVVQLISVCCRCKIKHWSRFLCLCALAAGALVRFPTLCRVFSCPRDRLDKSATNKRIYAFDTASLGARVNANNRVLLVRGVLSCRCRMGTANARPADGRVEAWQAKRWCRK